MAAFAKFMGKAKGAGGAIGGLDTFTGNVACATVLGLFGGMLWRNQQYNEMRNTQKANAAEKKKFDAFEAKYVAEREKKGIKTDPAQEMYHLMLMTTGEGFKFSETAESNGKPLNPKKN